MPLMERSIEFSWKRFLSVSTILAAALSSTGCQIDVAGQTLPSAHYRQDDIQYVEVGPEFKLSNEAAAMKAYRAQQQLGE